MSTENGYVNACCLKQGFQPSCYGTRSYCLIRPDDGQEQLRFCASYIDCIRSSYALRVVTGHRSEFEGKDG